MLRIRKELKSNIDQKYKRGAKAYFKEEIKIYGVRTPIVRKIAQKYFALIKNEGREKVFELCEDLLESGYGEEKHIAFDWAYRLKKEYKESDFKIFEKWLKRYVSDWGACDDFCTHALAHLIFSFPALVFNVRKWVNSKNRWLRRASAVIFIYSVRKGKYLDHVFWVADQLLTDRDDLVQKGYGWMLKEASKLYQKEIFGFVMKRKSIMPRTALRYAIEKMPENLRQKAMK